MTDLLDKSIEVIKSYQKELNNYKEMVELQKEIIKLQEERILTLTMLLN